ncbi:MAG: cupin domain-containing protein, partial [Thermoanaerobaculia bacterium]
MRDRRETASSETLAYGEFYGVFERRFDIPQVSLAVIAPDDIWMGGKQHSHEATHIILVLDGDYILSVNGRQRTLPPRSLIFVPAGTRHANHPAAPGAACFSRLRRLAAAAEHSGGDDQCGQTSEDQAGIVCCLRPCVLERIAHVLMR